MGRSATGRRVACGPRQMDGTSRPLDVVGFMSGEGNVIGRRSHAIGWIDLGFSGSGHGSSSIIVGCGSSAKDE